MVFGLSYHTVINYRYEGRPYQEIIPRYVSVSKGCISLSFQDEISLSQNGNGDIISVHLYKLNGRFNIEVLTLYKWYKISKMFTLLSFFVSIMVGLKICEQYDLRVPTDQTFENPWLGGFILLGYFSCNPYRIDFKKNKLFFGKCLEIS